MGSVENEMKSKPTINAPEEEPPFQVDENDNPPDLVDINIEDDIYIVAKQVHDGGDADDEEAEDVPNLGDGDEGAL